MNFFMARTTEAHEVRLIVCSSFGERNDVMDFLNRNVSSFLQALLAERMLVDVPVTDSFPRPAVAFAGRVAALELLVVLFHDLGVLLAVNTVGQVRAAGKAARSLWFHWHKPRLLSGKEKALRVCTHKARAAVRSAVLYSFSLIIYYHKG
jgi:hypothetical protein